MTQLDGNNSVFALKYNVDRLVERWYAREVGLEDEHKGLILDLDAHIRRVSGRASPTDKLYSYVCALIDSNQTFQLAAVNELPQVDCTDDDKWKMVVETSATAIMRRVFGDASDA